MTKNQRTKMFNFDNIKRFVDVENDETICFLRDERGTCLLYAAPHINQPTYLLKNKKTMILMKKTWSKCDYWTLFNAPSCVVNHALEVEHFENGHVQSKIEELNDVCKYEKVD